jgi:hypothetical protein
LKKSFLFKKKKKRLCCIKANCCPADRFDISGIIFWAWIAKKNVIVNDFFFSLKDMGANSQQQLL